MPGCWDSASNTGRTADGRPAARIAGRRGAGVPSAGGATGFLLPSSEARSRASAAPSLLLDIFSRCVVGWMVADRENAALAATLIEETCLKQGIEPQVLTLHSDRGAPMTSKCTAQLLADLGVTRSLSRPQVSDDNPFSEAQFKTLKYHPGFPGRFEDITAAIAFCRSFFPWYNTEHRHAGIAMLTPDDVHHHRAPDVLAQRGRTLQAAWALHPERFVHGTPKPAPLPEAVWINPPATSTTGETSQ